MKQILKYLNPIHLPETESISFWKSSKAPICCISKPFKTSYIYLFYYILGSKFSSFLFRFQSSADL